MQKMSPKVKEVKTMEKYKLLITFDNSEQKIFNLEPYLEYDVFNPLKNKVEFEKVYIDFGTICFECGADLSRDTLYLKGIPVLNNNIEMI